MTFGQFERLFPDENACLEYIRQKKGISGTRIGARKSFLSGRKQVSPLRGTIFERSRTSLRAWFFALWLFSVSKHGVSAKELERQLGVTYKTAWRIAHKIRTLMKQANTPLSGTVEVDETYWGGKARMKAKMGNKTGILGMVERGGGVRAFTIPSRRKFTLMHQVWKNVKAGSTLYTDEYKGYNPSRWLGYRRESVKHSAYEFARGPVHTNGIEGFWSQFKRAVHGTYRFISKKHLQSYLDERVFSWNHRENAFEELLSRL